jgi:Tol biopolymer transport system component
VIGLTTCTSGPKSPRVEPEEIVAGESTVVGEGDSSQPSYSPDGKRLLFISKNRRSHAHAQVYEKDLESGTERRITFQNGSTAFPRYNPKEGWIIYSSSTDELKEEAPMLKSETPPSTMPVPYSEPYELYLHSFKGFEIVRFTNFPGFDGEGRYNPDGSIVWTRVVKGKLQVMTAARGSKQAHPIKGPGKNSSQWNSTSDGKRRAWVDWSDDFTTSKIQFQDGKKQIFEIAPDIAGFKTDLSFSPDGKNLLWSQVNPKTTKFEIWDFEIETACTRKLVVGAGDRRHPAVSPDLKWLTFTSWRKDRSRIAQVAFTPSAGPCVTAP